MGIVSSLGSGGDSGFFGSGSSFLISSSASASNTRGINLLSGSYSGFIIGISLFNSGGIS